MTLEIDLRNDGGDGGIGAGLNVDTGIINGYDGWIDAGFVPLEFQIYSNKSVSGRIPRSSGPFISITFASAGTWQACPATTMADGVVDAADYVAWRNGGPLPNEVADSAVDPADYNDWRQHFRRTRSGSGLGSGACRNRRAVCCWLLAASCAGAGSQTMASTAAFGGECLSSEWDALSVLSHLSLFWRFNMRNVFGVRRDDGRDFVFGGRR